MLGALAVALLIGVAGGAVLADYAGERLTDNAIGRFMDDTNEADVIREVRAFAVTLQP